ncbi:MAG: oligoendopeptidase F, partial [Candidatus Latescibacteria bacterium]|nr:oligoendopeptidase F [Candidatus Latescibacterota bacterium]
MSDYSDYKVGRWDLSELLPSEEEAVISERLESLGEAVGTFEARRAELGADISAEVVMKILKEYEHLIEEMQVLSAYGSLRFAADTQSPDALTLRNRIQHELTALGNRTLFFSLWWKNLDDADAGRLLPDGTEHTDYRHFLKDLRRFAP